MYSEYQVQTLSYAKRFYAKQTKLPEKCKDLLCFLLLKSITDFIAGAGWAENHKKTFTERWIDEISFGTFKVCYIPYVHGDPRLILHELYKVKVWTSSYTSWGEEESGRELSETRMAFLNVF